MSEPNTTAAPPADPNCHPRRRRGRTAFFVVMVALAAGVTGAFVSNAFSHGYGFGPRAWYGRGIMDGAMDPAQAAKRADRMVRHLAIEVDATAEQQDKLRAIAKAALNDLIPLRNKAQSARDRARALLTETTIDRAAIEAFRAEQIATADAVSRRLAQALADAAEVLTPEQRRKVSDLIPPRRGFWRGRHGG